MSDVERVEMKGSPEAIVRVDAWQAKADELRALMLEAGHDAATVADHLRTAFGDITFVDTLARHWRHDGQAWWRWQDPSWLADTPPAELHLESVLFEVEPNAADTGAAAAGRAAAAWDPPAAGPVETPYRATHHVPAAGMWAWLAPDPTIPAAATLDPWLDVQLLEQRPDGWARVRCSNGWEAWVDGRALAPG